jgi:hypothetical protein
MTLMLLTVGLLAILVVLAVVTARLFRDYPASELLDWKPTRSPELEAQNEVDDVRQMLEAQNEYRRRRGAEERTEADVDRLAREDEAVRARGRGPFAQGASVEDDLDSPEPPRSGSDRGRAKKKP